MEPKEGELVNQGPFWEGSFERENHNYVLRVLLQDPSGDIARQVLSTMVEVPDEASPGPDSEAGSAGDGEEEDGPAPGYNLIQTPDESLSVEVPPSWGVETGEDSEKQAGPNTWSHHAGEYLISSITTAPNLDAWYSTGTSGAYLVASKTLTQYSDYELTLFSTLTGRRTALLGLTKTTTGRPTRGRYRPGTTVGRTARPPTRWLPGRRVEGAWSCSTRGSQMRPTARP
jgi:hypothetical protein